MPRLLRAMSKSSLWILVNAVQGQTSRLVHHRYPLLQWPGMEMLAFVNLICLAPQYSINSHSTVGRFSSAIVDLVTLNTTLLRGCRHILDDCGFPLLTLSVASVSAPPWRSAVTTVTLPLRAAHMRAVPQHCPNHKRTQLVAEIISKTAEVDDGQ
jgi:hypothetical protein